MNRQLSHASFNDAESWITPSGTPVGWLSGEDGAYVAEARRWRFESPSYHKARAALAAELERRGWEMPHG